MRHLVDSAIAFLNGLALILERESGYQLMSLFLVLIGIRILAPAQRPEVAHDLISFGLGVLARSMSGKNSAPAPVLPTPAAPTP